MECKALKYWKMIDKNWLEDASINRFKKNFDSNKAIGYKQMGEFIENSFVFFGRDGGDLYEAIDTFVLSKLRKKYSDVEISKMLNITIPTDLLDINEDGNIIYIDNSPYCDYYYEYIDGQVNDLLCDIQIAYDIGGKSAIKELRKIYTSIDDEIFNFFLTQKTRAYKEKELYGDDKMSKPFWTALSELKIGNNGVTVFWTDGTMYINGEDDTQASTSWISLFQAYRFALLINTPYFDYDASDEEIKELQKELLEFYKEDFYEDEKEKYIVDVWEYLDDIADDYKKLTGVDINDIDYKRAIVSYMSDTHEEECGMAYGSGTYIARLISDHILGDDRNNVKGCNNPVAIKLAEKYLPTEDYNIIEFAKALHNATKEESIYIRGSVWINYAKYEYVDYIIITAEEVELYKDKKLIGNIERDKINTIQEQCVENNTINNINDIVAFDIKKVGDF